MTLSENRVDPSELSEKELDQLQPILNFAEQKQQPVLKAPDGTEYPIPEPIFDVLINIISGMRHGKAMAIIREDETFTTQAAANYLGMSRQFLVTLLESKEIPFHRVGSHRRVYYKDLRGYADKRAKTRRSELSKIFHELDSEGVYDAELKENAQ